MFAGEGDPFRTNAPSIAVERPAAKRSRPSFDSVTLYRLRPGPRPDIYGKIGNSGVSIATLEDMKALYSGFNLCDPATSVSMTINGRRRDLAMFQHRRRSAGDKFREEKGASRPPASAGDRGADLSTVRGTVQADILKEDQGQKPASSPRVLPQGNGESGYFIEHDVRNSIPLDLGLSRSPSAANPISQLAFTARNGFTFVEAYSRAE